MIRGTAIWGVLIAGFLMPFAVFADAIYEVDATGKETRIADGVIVETVSKNGSKISFVNYYYWHKRKLILVQESTPSYGPDTKESLRVVYSEREQRQKLIASIKSQGVQARITDVKGRVLDCFCLKASYAPPSGFSLFGGPEADALVRFQDNNRKDEKWEEIPFSSFNSIELLQGNRILVVMKDGKKREGDWHPAGKANGKPLEIILSGISDPGKHFTIDLKDVVKIDIVHK